MGTDWRPYLFRVLESFAYMALIGGFLVWQAGNLQDLSEFKAIAVVAIAELIRAKFRTSTPQEPSP